MIFLIMINYRPTKFIGFTFADKDKYLTNHILFQIRFYILFLKSNQNFGKTFRFRKFNCINLNFKNLLKFELIQF